MLFGKRTVYPFGENRLGKALCEVTSSYLLATGKYQKIAKLRQEEDEDRIAEKLQPKRFSRNCGSEVLM